MPNELFAPDEVFVGRDLGGRTVTVTHADVERYRAGTGDDSLADSDQPDAASVPTLLFHSEVYRNLAWYLPNLIGNLHAKQEWELFAPLRLGQTVRTRSTVVGRYRKRTREYVVNEVLLTDGDGRWLQRSRTHQSFLIDEPNADIVVDKDRERRADRRFEIAADGESLSPITRTITLEMCEAFSGPVKNYHTDREMARALGFPDIVVQGMWSICLVSELMTRGFGVGWLCGGQLAVNLVNVLWAEEVVTARGSIRSREPEGQRTRVHVDVWCEKGDGIKIVIGTASALQREIDRPPTGQ
jgi:acyl dehydratase